jgi:LysR family transcriptional regulator, regulator for bpeEF and oprC
MNVFEGMRSFTRVARAGSFSLAAKQFGVTQSKMSKQIAALEHELGVQLLSRNTRRVRLTLDGVDYLKFAERILDLLDQAEAHIGRGKAAPIGRVRIGSPIMFATVFLLSKVVALLQTHPLLQFEVIVSDGSPNLIEQDIDVAVRFGGLSGDVVASRIGLIRRVVIASPNYLERCGVPERPQDLRRHQCLLFEVPALDRDWTFNGPDGATTLDVQSRFTSNSSQVIREACVLGLGVAMLPRWLCSQQLKAGALIPILERYEPRGLPVSIVYPSRDNMPLKTRVVTDFLSSTLRRELARESRTNP